MNPGSITQLVSAINDLQNVVIMCSFVLVYVIGFVSALKLMSMLPS